MKNLIVLAMLALGLATSAQESLKTETPIKGAFGYVLGESFVLPAKPDYIGSPSKCQVKVTPPTPFRGYEIYTVSFTPSERKICSVVAIKSFASFEDAKAELDVVKAALESKYGDMSVETSQLGRAYILQRGGNVIMIAAKPGYPRSAVMINFASEKLLQDARSERSKAEAQKSDLSGI